MYNSQVQNDCYKLPVLLQRSHLEVSQCGGKQGIYTLHMQSDM